MILSHIVAASENNVIGVENDLPWHIPEDLKYFKDKTSGKIIIMGRKTFESFPNNRPLPNRLHIVISRNKAYQQHGVIVVHSIDQAIEESKKYTDKYGEEVFIIGGGEIYKQSLSKINKIYITRVHKKVQGDTVYPEVDVNQFQLVECVNNTGRVNYDFLTYIKKN